MSHSDTVKNVTSVSVGKCKVQYCDAYQCALKMSIGPTTAMYAFKYAGMRVSVQLSYRSKVPMKRPFLVIL